MVLVVCERTRTFGLCSIYFFCNMIALKSFCAYGKNDLVFVSDGRVFRKNYRFEDFFWTGSEDEIKKENSFLNETYLETSLVEASSFETWRTTTVFHTTTILFATVYPNSDNCKGTENGCTPQVSPVQTRSIEFSLSTFIPEVSEILPCPTRKVSVTGTFEYPRFVPSLGDESAIEETSTLVSSKALTTVQTKTENDSPVPKADLDKNNATGSTVFPTFSLDQKYWIMTILRIDNFSRNLELNLTENKLSTLYKKALTRRQEKYFGGKDFQDRRERKLLLPVKVNILNMTRMGKNVEIVYYVSVAGEPVPAMTAANDMRLMTASEVIAELGYPILSKAEPYIKNVVPLGARVKGRARDTWLFIGSVVAAVLLLIILATLFALGLSKKQNRSKDLKNRKQVFEKENGNRNLAFESDDTKCLPQLAHRSQTKRKDFQAVSQSAGTSVKFMDEDRRGSATSSTCSGSSEASLVRLRHQQRKKEKGMKEKEERPKPKPRTRIRKIENSDCCRGCERHGLERAGSAISGNTFNEMTTEGPDDPHYSPYLTKSPTSYLSMPSVRAFPRGAQIPEPLNKVLEPISIRHFDADSDSPNEYPHVSQIHHKVDVEQICEMKNKCVKRKTVTRHASLEGDDPGFIGPVVWTRHCQKISEGEKGSKTTMKAHVLGEIDVEEIDENVNVRKMRKRFNELLDDALSMFGSRNPSPEGIEGGLIKPTDNRVHSAVVRPADLLSDSIAGSRPKTAGSKRPQSAVISVPRGAWETPSCSTLVRSETTAVFQKLSPSPTIDRDLINVNSELAPCDPAVPLIAAIKNELKKFEESPCNK